MTGKKIFLILTGSMVALVLIQTHLRPFGDMVLSGAEEKKPMSAPTLSGIINGTFQDSVEAWIKQHIGFRGFFVKLDNQINYSVFREFSSNHPRKLILGKDLQLFEEPYIDLYNRVAVADQGDLEKKVTSLKRLQESLRGRNVTLLLIVTPSKTTIYPEYIPDRMVMTKNLDRRDNYQTLLPLLERHGINFIDGRKMFLELKGEGEPQLFPSSGIHWSLYGAYLFTARMIAEMERMSGRRMARIVSRGTVARREPIDLDKDIARLANVLFTRALFTEYLYPVTHTDAPPGAWRPDVLIVGSSFCWNILHYLDAHGVFSPLGFYYYFNTAYSYPGKKRRPIDRERVDWRGEILSRNFVIIEVNEVAIGEMGYDFIETALRNLGSGGRGIKK
ncbi:MAG: hypothetical protein JW838_07030 [Spirochaetes bacterium]|nr:hypothetical protein [Spirochaetota bacterium]